MKLKSLQDYIDNASNTKERLLLNAIKLFSKKGVDNVGIRELCRECGIKESSFYNHYKGKDAMFSAIIERFKDGNKKVALDEADVQTIIESKQVARLFHYSMNKFSQVTGNPLFYNILRIIIMESYIRKEAYIASKQNLYYTRKDGMEKALQGLIDTGCANKCDVKQVIAEYLYGLIGLLNEYTLLECWGEDLGQIMSKIKAHMDYFTNMLQVKK
ncbi:MAG: TetR/AcrR family transcriptional regulator [Firmicutes bacterium]|nr:TetR/AcrR family transcriptional regulator [Bacillota bacterium]